MRYMFKIVAPLLSAFLLFGCSLEAGVTTEPVANVETSEAHYGESHFCMGLYRMIADPVAQTLDGVPLRQAEVHLNVLPFLEPPPYTLLTLEKVKFIDYHHLNAHIGIRHPYLGLTQFTGFDVCGVLISNGCSVFGETGLVFPNGTTDTHLLNPDGYTRWWNPSEFPHDGTVFSYKDGLLGSNDAVEHFNAQLNPYKYYSDELEATDDILGCSPISRGMFSPYSMNTRKYEIYLNDDGLVFNYAIDACWKHPVGSSPWTAPDDFPPGANRDEAWAVHITELENTLYNDDWWPGGKLSLAIDVYDHFNADQNTVIVQSPGNFASVASSTPVSGDEGYSTYIMDITETSPVPDMIPLYIIVQSETMGFGGKLPGQPQCAYFMSYAEVAPEPYGCYLHVDDDNLLGPWDGSAEHPYKLIQDAVNNAVDDCIINVHPGHYHETGQLLVTGLDNITIRAKEDAVLYPPPPYEGTDAMGTIEAYNIDGLSILGLGIMPPYAEGFTYIALVKLTSAKNVTIRNCYLGDAELAGTYAIIKASSCSKLTISDNNFDGFHGASYYLTAFSMLACGKVLISSNSCLDMDAQKKTGQMELEISFNSLVGCSNVTICKNRFGLIAKDVPMPYAVESRFVNILSGGNIVIRNNLVYQIYPNNTNPLQHSNFFGISAQHIANLEIYNNTFADLGPTLATGSGRSEIISVYGDSGLVSHSNIMASINGLSICYGMRLDEFDPVPTQDYSDIWNITALNPEHAYRYDPEQLEGSGGINADPMFADPENGDYTLLPGSPCIGTGLNGCDMGCYSGDDPLPLDW